MQPAYRPLPYARLNSFHGPKRQLLGNQAGNVAPAWKVGMRDQIGGGAPIVKDKHRAQDQGSKILLSRLPVDVGETEIEVRCGIRLR